MKSTATRCIRFDTKLLPETYSSRLKPPGQIDTRKLLIHHKKMNYDIPEYIFSRYCSIATGKIHEILTDINITKNCFIRCIYTC